VAVREVVSALMSDDGVRTPLDRPYVFGREPQQDPAVAEGHASPIRLPDPEQLISRVQAYLYVDGDRVSVQDAHSANGTFIAAPGASEWQRLGEEPAPLPVGWSIRMGRRIFTHYGIGG
jgi:pSer/pThr/pTyr-binding forkhead associated (FHA) protein